MNDFQITLDRYLTTEPSNNYQGWYESIWNLIPEETISADEYNEHEAFFDYYIDHMYQSGQGGRPIARDFVAEVVIRRYQIMKKQGVCLIFTKGLVTT